MGIRVFVPYHITGFWIPIETGDPLTTGSLGAGLVLEKGIEVYMDSSSEGSREVLQLDRTSFTALQLLGCRDIDSFSKRIRIREVYGLGEGYGASGARALALSLAFAYLNGLTMCRAGQSAHIAEVINGTGYADVLAEFGGRGLAFRLRIGAPCIGVVDSVAIKPYRLITVPLGILTTIDMHRVYGDRIRELGYRVYREFISRPSLETFLELSYRFSRGVGFLSSELDSMLREALGTYLARGYILGYFVKKKLLVIALDTVDYVDEEIIHRVEKVTRIKPRIDRIGMRCAEVVPT